MEQLVAQKLQRLVQYYGLQLSQNAFDIMCQYVAFQFEMLAQVLLQTAADAGQGQAVDLRAADMDAVVACFMRAFSVSAEHVVQLPAHYNLCAAEDPEATQPPRPLVQWERGQFRTHYILPLGGPADR